MKNLLFMFIVSTTLLFASSTWAEFYVIAGAGGKPVGTEITALPAVVSSPGFYYITKNLTCPSGSHGISIETDDVTLDLMGFSLIGPGGNASNQSGISLTNRSNITIRNGTIKSFPACGISDNGSGDPGRANTAENIRVLNNGGTGIVFYQSYHCAIKGCTAVGNGTNGLEIHHSGIIANCTSTENGVTGIEAKYSTVINNSSYGNTQDGFNIGYGSTASNNSSNNNVRRGITSALGNLISNNTCSNNGGTGIYASAGCTISNNTSYNNGGDGIEVSEGSSVIGNTCYNNTGFGLNPNRYSLVDQNTLYNNTAGNMDTCSNCTVTVANVIP